MKIPKYLFFIGVVFSVFAEGAVLVSNLAEPIRATTTIDLNLWALQTFETDNNAYNLLDIRTMLGESTSGAGIVAELRAYDTLALLTTMTVPSLAGPVSVKTLTPDNAVTLEPNTIYALVFSLTGSGSFGWSYAQGQNQTGPGSLLDYAYSEDQGVTFPIIRDDNPYLIQVNVDAAGVPEPSTLALCVSALIAVSILKLRQRHPR